MTIQHIARRTVLAATLALGLNAVAHAEDVNLASNERATEQSIAAAILTDIYKKAGLTAKVQPMPPARANSLALSGEKDGEVARIQAYATKNATLIKVEPAYYSLTSSGFAKADKKIHIAGKDDLAKYKVGIIRGVAHSAAATEGMAGVQVVNDADQLYQMLDSGRIDIALDTSVNGPYVVKKLGLKGIEKVGDISRLDLFTILSPGKKDLEPKLSAAIKSLKDSGELAKLAKKHEDDFLASGAAP